MNKLIAALLLLFCLAAHAQQARLDFSAIKPLESDLKAFSDQMVFDTIPANRFNADSIFIKILVRALRTPYSFYYPFDSVKTVSKIYPADSTFRIFTWELQRDEGYFRQQGFIQMKTPDGSLKLYPLFDASDYAGPSITDSVRTTKNWVGAIYYGIVTKQYQGKKYYTLIGLDDNDFTTTRKWIDILTFTDEGQPVFGGPVFDYRDDSIKAPQPAYRFLYEFKKDANARLVYDPTMDMIVLDHLVSENNQLWRRETLIPDGDYEGFKWTNGKWVHVEKIFNFQLQDGQAPAPKPFYDANGNPLPPPPPSQ